MIFSVKYKYNDLSKIQDYLDYIFFEIWLKASPEIPFNYNLFLPNLDLYYMMKKYFESRKTIKFYESVKKIYHDFENLTESERGELMVIYISNNSIEKACKDISHRVGNFDRIEAISAPLSNDLKSFAVEMYEEFVKLQDVKSISGDMREYYNSIIEELPSSVCPSCGINELKSQYRRKRDAFDHYLPKATYPFTSMNLKNLMPMCHDCNSDCKGMKDPLFSSAGRRAVFYPFQEFSEDLQISVNLLSTDLTRLKNDGMGITINRTGFSNEMASWREIFEIDERYIEKIRNKGKAWLDSIIRSYKTKQNRGDSRSLHEFLYEQIGDFDLEPFEDKNFLKSAFLKACLAYKVI